MKFKFLLILMVLAIFGANAQSKKKTKLKTQSDTLSYCIGISIGNAIQSQKLEGLNEKIIANAIAIKAKGDSAMISLQDAEIFLRNYFTKKQQEEAAKILEKANSFLAENKKIQGVIELPSGLQYQVITQGNGAKPTDSSYVKVNYKGSLTDGKVFDSSYDRNEPAEFSVNGVIPGFTEALLLMNVGSKWKIFIPPHLGYGEQGAGGVIGPNEVLIFELELLETNLKPTSSEKGEPEEIQVEGE
jgi:FKBP-type peptidyl-prolyl cis-trans isomerase FklB